MQPLGNTMKYAVNILTLPEDPQMVTMALTHFWKFPDIYVSMHWMMYP